MNDYNSINELYYIVDGFSNYYRINGKDQLVVAGGKEEAGIFSFFEANQRIGGGKKAQFYSTIPVDAYEQAKLEAEDVYYPVVVQDAPDVYEAEPKMSLPYDMKSVDWREYLEHFCYIASGIQNYLDELNQALSDMDMQICDIMHYIELYDIDEEEGIRMVELLKECREQRRDVKDEICRVECFQRAIGTSSNIAKAKEGLKQMNKLDSRSYRPRRLKELFKDCPKKTERDNKLVRAFGGRTCLDVERVCEDWHNITDETQEVGVVMEYSRRNTIFDEKENNWKQFARQQAEFYSDAEQYIYNLQEDLTALEEQIEQTLHEIEDANYNVAQGYKVFRHLKELRNTKKEKLKELDCLYILTEKVDCRMLADIFGECVGEIETVLEEKCPD